MVEKEIIEGNILICDFMGWEKSVITGLGKTELKGYYVFAVPTNQTMYGRPYSDIERLKFHSSWDWLMPVVEKISEHYDFTISSVGLWVCYIDRKDCDWEDKHIGDMGGHEPVITNAFMAVVQFIKWYNTNKKLDHWNIEQLNTKP